MQFEKATCFSLDCSLIFWLWKLSGWLVKLFLEMVKFWFISLSPQIHTSEWVFISEDLKRKCISTMINDKFPKTKEYVVSTIQYQDNVDFMQINLFLLDRCWVSTFIWKYYERMFRKSHNKCEVAVSGSFCVTMS